MPHLETHAPQFGSYVQGQPGVAQHMFGILGTTALEATSCAYGCDLGSWLSADMGV